MQILLDLNGGERDHSAMNEHILMIRLSALGDVIFTLPTIAAIKDAFPNARVSWLVEDKASSLLMHRPDLHSILVYPRKEIRKALRNPIHWPSCMKVLARHVSTLRKERYDRVFDFQGNLKSGVHAWLARSALSIGFDWKNSKECNPAFTQLRIRTPEKAVHRIEKSFSLVCPDFDPEDIKRPDLYLPPELVEEARASVADRLVADRPLLIIHPGTSAFGAFKRWAPENYGRLAARLRDEEGWQTLVTWGPDEKELAQTVCDTAGEGVLMAPDTRSLMHLAAFISLGDAYISADSGPLHLANYLGIPCLALFGPKDPALYRPYFQPSRVARSGVDCSPCPKRKCDDPICMTQLTVDAVHDTFCDLMESV